MAEIARRLRGPADTVPFVGPLCDLALDDPTLAIAAVQKLRVVLDEAEALAVATARAQRLTWQEIGATLGLPESTAHRKFRHLDAHPRHHRSTSPA